MVLAMHSVDVFALAERQLARDRARTRPFAGLFEHKLERMRVSPLAYLRGAAPLYYELLAEHPELREGPPGDGWIAGDLHLENFGAYRPLTHAADDDPRLQKRHPRDEIATFNLNDFDDAVQGPWYFDVLRLTTSLVLGARELRFGGTDAVAICESLLESYVAQVWQRGRGGLPPAPAPVLALTARVHGRTRKELLQGRTVASHGARRFVRGPRYRPIAAALAGAARRAFAKYVAELTADAVDPAQMKVKDVAFRVAGTGSLGGLRVAVLTEGKGGVDGGWVFDMKEEGAPSAAAVLGAPHVDPAKRVVTALRACLAAPPRMLGTTRLGERSMFVRRLSPQEDKLDLTGLPAAELHALARYLGALAGVAHRRGAHELPKKRWSEKDIELVLHNAIALAAIHEGAYLAMCKLTR